MRLSLKYPAEKFPIWFDFSRELAGRAPKSVAVSVRLDRGAVIEDPKAAEVARGEPWMEKGILFQLVGGGMHGADYRFEARVELPDGTVFQKVSVLPVREE